MDSRIKAGSTLHVSPLDGTQGKKEDAMSKFDIDFGPSPHHGSQAKTSTFGPATLGVPGSARLASDKDLLEVPALPSPGNALPEAVHDDVPLVPADDPDEVEMR